MDGDEPREGFVGKVKPLDEEVELGGPAGVLHGVVQLPPAQHMDVALPKEGVCKKRKGKMRNFQGFGFFQPVFLCASRYRGPAVLGFSASVGG